jgi:hypothetical protein
LDLVILGKSVKYFNIVFRKFFFNLTTVGLYPFGIKIRYFFQNSRVIRFVIVGFEIILVKRQLRTRKEIFNCNFTAFIKPEQLAIYNIKLKIRKILRSLFKVNFNQIYLIFRHLNLLIIKWHAYFFFYPCCVYGGRVDIFDKIYMYFYFIKLNNIGIIIMVKSYVLFLDYMILLFLIYISKLDKHIRFFQKFYLYQTFTN